MGMMSPELSLDLKPSNVTGNIAGFLRDVSMIGDVMERLDKIDELIRRLEDELKKIEVFKRELPLCMLLLKDAIVYLKEESAQYRTKNAHQPVLEEFIPLRKENGGEINPINNNNNSNKADEEDSSRDKKDWMSSVQLWSADNLPTSTAQTINQNQNLNQNQALVSESQKVDDKRNKIVGDDLHDPSKHRTGNKGFVPMIHTYPTFPEFRRKVDKEDVGVPGLSLLIPGIKHPQQDLISNGLNSKFGVGCGRISTSPSPASNGQSNIRPVHQQQANSRKQRRCWSPELHRRFVDALTQLGGPQVATPKQIRELMRVDGLTNDEVKSHLQKYRLHTRRVPNNSAASTNENCNDLEDSWATKAPYSDTSKPISSQSGSPEGPHDFPDSMEDDYEEKSECYYSWKGHTQRPGKVDV